MNNSLRTKAMLWYKQRSVQKTRKQNVVSAKLINLFFFFVRALTHELRVNEMQRCSNSVSNFLSNPARCAHLLTPQQRPQTSQTPWPCSPTSEPQRASAPAPSPPWPRLLLPTWTGPRAPRRRPPASRGSGQPGRFLLTPQSASRQALSSPWRPNDENKPLLALRRNQMRNGAMERNVTKVDKALKDWEKHVFTWQKSNED